MADKKPKFRVHNTAAPDGTRIFAAGFTLAEFCFMNRCSPDHVSVTSNADQIKFALANPGKLMRGPGTYTSGETAPIPDGALQYRFLAEYRENQTYMIPSSTKSLLSYLRDEGVATPLAASKSRERLLDLELIVEVEGGYLMTDTGRIIADLPQKSVNVRNALRKHAHMVSRASAIENKKKRAESQAEIESATLHTLQALSDHLAQIVRFEVVESAFLKLQSARRAAGIPERFL